MTSRLLGAAIFALALVSTGQAQMTTSTPLGGPNGLIKTVALVSAAHGWVLAGDHLRWTSDNGGQWSDITPPLGPTRSIDVVFFLDEIHAWAVLHDKSAPGIYIAATSSGGRAWTIKQVAARDSEMNALYGNAAHLSFTDPLQGWALLTKTSSSAASRTGLFVTQDGGQDWSRLPDPPVNGTIRFISQQTGWLCGGVHGDELYVTRDGGLTWGRQALAPPTGVDPTSRSTYNLPQFQDPKRATAAVVYYAPRSGEAPAGASVTGVYETADAGDTWQLRNSYNRSHPMPLSTVGAIVIEAFPAPDSIVIGSGANRHVAAMPPELSPGHFDVDTLSFVDANTGWLLLSRNRGCIKPGCVTVSALLSTADGGRTVSLLFQNTETRPVAAAPANPGGVEAAVTPGR